MKKVLAVAVLAVLTVTVWGTASAEENCSSIVGSYMKKLGEPTMVVCECVESGFCDTLPAFDSIFCNGIAFSCGSWNSGTESADEAHADAIAKKKENEAKALEKKDPSVLRRFGRIDHTTAVKANTDDLRTAYFGDEAEEEKEEESDAVEFEAPLAQEVYCSSKQWLYETGQIDWCAFDAAGCVECDDGDFICEHNNMKRRNACKLKNVNVSEGDSEQEEESTGSTESEFDKMRSRTISIWR